MEAQRPHTRTFTFFLFAFLFILLFSKTGNATHGQGADLTYTCLGNNEYRIRVSFYRDCAGINAPAAINVDASSVSCGENLSVTLDQVAGTGQDVTPICDSEDTECSGGNHPGVEEYVYTGTVTLPQQCPDWNFDFSVCCRNQAITTIDQPNNEEIHLNATLNNQDYPCNSSPSFSNPPVPYICVGETYCFNHGAQDPDGDSLSYSLVTPSSGPNGNTVNYNNGYSATQPLQSNPAVSIDPVTGDICMTPTQQEVSVMQVQVKEWRNGEVIGVVNRDVQVQVVACSNNLPYLSGINGNGEYTRNVCAGSQVQFQIPSFDADGTQDLTLSWNNGIPSGTFNAGTGSRPTGTFTWMPNSSHIGNGPHCFTVKVEDDNCPLNGSQVYSFCLTVNGIDSLALSSTSANCGASNGSASVDSVYGSSGSFNYTWTPVTGNNHSADYNGIPADTYTVEVTDTAGCAVVDSVVVGPGSLPGNTNINSVQPSCNGGSDGSATVQVNGGQGPYQYAWSNGDSSATADSLSAGTYNVEVITDAGCYSYDTVTIQEPAPLSLALDSLSEPLCHGDSNGYGAVSAQGGTPPYNFQWSTSPVQTGQQTNSLYAGSFTVTVTDGNGCQDMLSVSLQDPAPLSSSMSVTPPSCNGGSDGSISVTVSGGASPYQYDWAGYPSMNSSTLNNIGAGTYTVEVTDDNGCTLQDTAQVGEPPTLSLDSIDLKHPTCNGYDDGSIMVEGNGGTPSYSYHWKGLAQSGPSVGGLGVGTYTVELVDAHGCVLVDSFQLQDPPPLNVQVDSIQHVACHGGSDGGAFASASGGNGGYTYTWYLGGSQQSGPGSSGLSAGTYTVQVTDSAGCTDDTSFQVNEPAPLSLALDSSSDPLCNGDANGSATVNATGGSSPYTYFWSTTPTQSGQQSQNLTAGTYTVTLTDDNGCNDSLSVTLQEPAPLSSSMSVQDPQCYGAQDGQATVSVSGGTGPYQYDWQGFNVQQPSLSNIGDGQYVVEVTDQNGCSIMDTAQLDDPARLDIDTLAMEDPVCYGGESGSLAVSVNGGTPPYSYHWSGTNQSGPQLGNLGAGTYVLEVLDANHCSRVDSFTLQQPTPLQVQIDSVFDVACHGGSNGAVTASASGGTGPYSYSWDLDSQQTGASAFGLSAGSYTVTVTDDEGCQATKGFQVDEPAQLDLTLTPVADTICPQDSVTLSASASGGNGQYIYVWGQGLGTGASHTVSPSHSTDYSVIGYDTAGCSSSGDTVSIAVRELRRNELKANGSGPICEGEMATISAVYQEEGADLTFDWGQGIGTGKGPHHVLPTDSTTYTVTVTDQCRNQLVDSVMIPVHSEPPIKVQVPDAEGCGSASVVCRNDTARAASTELKWYFSSGDSSETIEPQLEFDNSGTHAAKLVLTSKHGCQNSEQEQFSVEVHPVPSAEFEVSPDNKISIMDPEVSFHYNDPYAVDHSFAFGDGDSSELSDPTHYYEELGTYPVTLKAVSAHGCSARSVQDIIVEDRFTYYVPNAFSPDGDGVNDEFDGKGAGYTTRELMIFNRWGKLIFESQDPERDWDGTVNGKKVKQDVYVYKIRVKDHRGRWHTKEGHVTVVR